MWRLNIAEKGDASFGATVKDNRTQSDMTNVTSLQIIPIDILRDTKTTKKKSGKWGNREMGKWEKEEEEKEAIVHFNNFSYFTQFIIRTFDRMAIIS